MLAFTHLFSATVALTSALTPVIAAPQPFSAAPALAPRASVCNGDASLCSRLYSNVTYIGAHNSYAVGTLAGATTGKNQEQDVTQQLNDGIRLLQVQAHRNTNSTGASGIDLCHSSCELENGGSLESYLTKVNSWLAANPNDVVTLLIVNADDQSASTFGGAFSSTGISSRAYSPSSNVIAKSSWPTLSSLIDSGKNLVVFIDNSADASVPYILPHFSNTWENPYDQTSVPFNCSIDRINSGSSASNLMYLVNHYLDSTFNLFGTNVYVPNTAELSTTNSLNSIMTDTNNCASMHGGSWPTFVLTDFYDVGNGSVFQAAARMNGVQYVAKAIGNATTGGSTGSGSGSGSSTGRGSSSAASKLGMMGSGALALIALVAASTLV
ncbi:PLC-like phosphodiesterase, TIM beta/alpha-barrel domain protein [Kalmanozyma brasiliensis GHG001]|uniref:PLC-like phosphodiesterase n=1 Tax=Kalmanozyma brasiliensis (strain GHG001) TaxID=1365824 RepID=V5GEK0_KALBG|nr:PLC-like phosphodiesterase, TIM beta/alpha-barrel domain protein [Kalmanozyma brasiliensis GHG001]EST04477.1 PLC-like phosphodiesterase, TIM beta/alpha-barrel domain protein [Kalmanozyma brasiliensis GHG001]